MTKVGVVVYNKQFIYKQCISLFFIIVALWIILEQDQYDESKSKSLSLSSTSEDDNLTITIWDILLKHEPSWRIFRSLFEINLIIIMISISIYIWEHYMIIPYHTNDIDNDNDHDNTTITNPNIKIIEQLLFRPVKEQLNNEKYSNTTNPFILPDDNDDHDLNIDEDDDDEVDQTIDTSNDQQHHYDTYIDSNDIDKTSDVHDRDNKDITDHDIRMIGIDTVMNHNINNNNIEQQEVEDCQNDIHDVDYDDHRSIDSVELCEVPLLEEGGVGLTEEVVEEHIKVTTSSSDDLHKVMNIPINRYNTTSSTSTEITDNKTHHDDNDLKIRMNHNHTYIPSSIYVLSIGLDMLIMILITLFAYIIKSSGSYYYYYNYHFNNNDIELEDNVYYTISYILRWMTQVAGPSIPLLLFIYYVLIRSIYKWNNIRKELWSIVSLTLSTPIYSVSFRDGFIGDILTSTVRPLQDIIFTIFYILFGLNGWYSFNYYYHNTNNNDHNHNINYNNINNSSTTILSSSTSTSFINIADMNIPKMESSWMIHTIILPACMISPLWWRFIQTLRQVYDHKVRWPYLGNTFKYFIAAQVSMIGVYQPHYKHTYIWIISFIIATLYQIYWDIFMDWNLLECVYTIISSSTTSSSLHYNNNNNNTTMIQKRWTYPYYQLRSKRLYPYKTIYWSICFINIILRFFWTLTFIPTKYLDAATGLLRLDDGLLSYVTTNEHIFIPFIACIEIIRRSIWGLLRVEWEVIKVTSTTNTSATTTTEAMAHDKISEDDINQEVSIVFNDQQELQTSDDGGKHQQSSKLQQQIMFELQDMKPMDIQSSDTSDSMNYMNRRRKYYYDIVSNRLRQRLHIPFFTKDMSLMDDVQILIELTFYTCVFAVLGFLYAYHRGTL